MAKPGIPKLVKFCGTCRHYCWIVGPNRKTTCNNLGSIDTTPGCLDYAINPFVLKDYISVLKPLSEVLRVMPLTVLPMFYEIIAQEKVLRRRGFYFMEKVAIKYYGSAADKYISNYVVAHVFSSTDEGVLVISKSGIRMFVLKENVIKFALFLEMRRDLKEAGKNVDPTIKMRSVKQKLALTETLDDILDRGLLDDEDLDKSLKSKFSTSKINRRITDPEEGLGIKEKKKTMKFSEMEISTRSPIKKGGSK
jgi:hypothetical protein